MRRWCGRRPTSQALTAHTGLGFIEGSETTSDIGRPGMFAILPGVDCAAREEGIDPALATEEMQSKMPGRERAFIRLLLAARRQYEAASPGAERQRCRLAMQVAVGRFMSQNQDVENWVGVFRGSHTNLEGDRWIQIEIAPGVTIGTGRDRLDDPDLLTLIEPHSENYAALDAIGVGQPVVFSGRVLAGKLSSDDDMVEQPRFVAHFSALSLAR